MKIYVVNALELAPYSQTALPLLSEERQNHARRQHGEENFLRALAAGLLLRRYVGSAPLTYGAWGKPSMPGGAAFSLSHGGALAVLALGDGEDEVGVDAECGERPWKEVVARRVFTAEEQSWLAQAQEADAFFFLWTRKEAALKCCGRGLTLSPSSFSVLPDAACLPEGTPCHLHTFRYKRHVISAASTRPGLALLQPLSPESLLL